MLKPVQRILYASDLGKGARPACRCAVQQAIKHGAEMIFFHAMEPLSELTNNVIEEHLPGGLTHKHEEQILANQIARIEKRIQDFLDAELDAVDELEKPIAIEVRIGRPEELILETATEKKVDMIVMGDRETNSFSRIFLGSTAQKVIHHSEIPVLIVPLKK